MTEKQTCISCETQCNQCKSKYHRNMKIVHYDEQIKIPRYIVEKAINLCPDDDFRKLIGEYLN